MELELRQVLRTARRWWWLLILGPLLMGALAVAVTTRQTPMYAAQATLQINPTQSTGVLDYNMILLAERLAKTYERLITVRPVLEPVIEELNLPYGVDELDNKITARTDETQLLELSVSDPDPQRAAQIANAVAAQFSEFVAGQAAQRTAAPSAELEAPLAALQQQIDEIEQQISQLEAGPNSEDPDVQNQIAVLQSTLDDVSPLYAQLLLTVETANLGAATADGQVTIAEPAVAPAIPYAPRFTLNVLLGVFVGMVIVAGVIALLTYLDNTVKTGTDFGSLAGAPLLATIGAIPQLTNGRQQLFVLEQSMGSAAEAIRLLRTNIEFASAAREIGTMAISSPNPGEGKSTVAANLAVTLAQAGFITALVDADLRRPSQQHIFRVPNDRGLSTILTVADLPWQRAALDVAGVPNLTLIPSGPLPPNPSDLLSLERLRDLLKDLKQAFDVIVLDTTPILPVSDALVVAAHADGVILVCRSGRTRIDALRRAAETLQHGAVRVIGGILNQQQGRGSDGYYGAAYHAEATGQGAGTRGDAQSAPEMGYGARQVGRTPAD